MGVPCPKCPGPFRALYCEKAKVTSKRKPEEGYRLDEDLTKSNDKDDQKLERRDWWVPRQASSVEFKRGVLSIWFAQGWIYYWAAVSLTLRVNLTLSQQQHLLRSSKGPFTSLSLLILTIILQGRDYHNSHLKGRLWSRRLRNSLRTQEEEEARQEPGPRLFSTGLRPTFPTPRRLFVRRGLRSSWQFWETLVL